MLKSILFYAKLMFWLYNILFFYLKKIKKTITSRFLLLTDLDAVFKLSSIFFLPFLVPLYREMEKNTTNQFALLLITFQKFFYFQKSVIESNKIKIKLIKLFIKYKQVLSIKLQL